MSVASRWFQLDQFADRERRIPPVDVRFGPERISELGSYLDARGRRRVMVVTGPHVSADENVMGPVRRALGNRIVGEFFEVTPDKHISSIYDGMERMRKVGADLLLGVGGGASLVMTRQISALAADGRSMSSVQEAVRSGAQVNLGVENGITEVVLLPTTLAGADLSTGGTFQVLSGAESPDGLPRVLNPTTVGAVGILYDPRLFESTPTALLAGSAMNGLNKAIETIYSPAATLLSDAMATRGLTLMSAGLLKLGADRRSGLELAVAGVIFGQLKRSTSIVHAFGHALTRELGVQQGLAHAVVTPHVLMMMLSREDLRRDVLATALRMGGATNELDDADAVVTGVVAVRDALGLPSRLVDLDAAPLDLDRCAEHVWADPLTRQAPLREPLTVSEVREVLRAAA